MIVVNAIIDGNRIKEKEMKNHKITNEKYIDYMGRVYDRINTHNDKSRQNM